MAVRWGYCALGLSATSANRARPVALTDGQRVEDVAQGRGDRAYMRKPTEDVPCTLFKASKTINRLVKHPNHLHHTLEGILGH